MKKNLISLGIVLSASSTMLGMEIEILESPIEDSCAKTRIVIIPGQNGDGGQNVCSILPEFKQVHVKTPEDIKKMDFGQEHCLQCLEDAVNPLLESDDVEKIIFHASSQGTATLINFLKKKSSPKFKAVILEAIMGSGNSAIHHTVKNMGSSKLEKLPWSYSWLPYLAKFFYRSYKPRGIQPIQDLDTIANTIPVIALHSTIDPQLSFSDAEAICQGLIKHGNKHVYFLPQKVYGHVRLINPIYNIDEVLKLRAILAGHDLIVRSSNPHDDFQLAEQSLYQPENFDAYESLLAKEGRGKPSKSEDSHTYCLSS